MKRKTVNLVLSLIVVFTMAAIVAPAGAAKVEAAGLGSGVYGGFSSYDLSQYDVRYVAIDPLTPTGEPGQDAGSVGSEEDPWRHIWYAVQELPYADGATGMDPSIGGADGVPEPDLIVVGPSEPTWYGGPTNPEVIVVDEAVVIVSRDGAAVTRIDVSGQNPATGPLMAVIHIIHSDVVIDGLWLASNGSENMPDWPANYGANTGVAAVGPAIDNPIEDVKVLNCRIKIDEYQEGYGIDFLNVKYDVKDGNDIDVGVMGGELDIGPASLSMAFGIIQENCFTSQVTNNELDVEGSSHAIGIQLKNCDKSLVGVLPEDEGSNPAPNDVEVLAGGDVVGIGIKVTDSDLIDIMYNLVTVEANGNAWGVAYGIKVKNSDRSQVNVNTVYVEMNLIGDGTGFLTARGIAIKYCDESEVNDNDVTVKGTGDVNVTIVTPGFGLDEDLAEDLAEFEPILLQSLGIDQSMAYGMGSAVGISVRDSMAVEVRDNTVDVDLSVDIVSADEPEASGGGGGCAIGISAVGSGGISVVDNDVTVDDVVRTWVNAYENLALESACGSGMSVALGITLISSPGMVEGNGVEANADLKVDIKSKGYASSTFDPGAALSVVDSQIMGAIYLQLEETLASEAIGVQVSGDLPGIQATGTGGGVAAGIGILVITSNVVSVNQNNPVIGTGDVDVDVWSYEQIPQQDVQATGGGVGLGVGIAIIGTRAATVNDNLGVNGTGTADVDVAAQHGGMDLHAGAAGGGAGIGIGILLCGTMAFQTEAEELPEGQCWPDRPVVSGNEVTASGIAVPVYISAEDLIESHEACAIGGGLGLALGIAAVWYPGIVIEDNMVNADAMAYVDIYAEAVHDFDPTSIGGAAAIGIGITTVQCFMPDIINNQAVGTGQAYSEVGATEKVVMESNALGGSIGLGMGIFVVDCVFGEVRGNSVATGKGDAECVVIAESFIPLSEATATSFATGIGKGIAVMWSPWTDVVRCNTAAGEGRARVSATYDADFGSAGALGFAGSYDIVMKLIHTHPWGPQFGVVQYNSMVDASPLDPGINAGPVIVMDAGLFKMGPYLNAWYNWWNDPTGPSGFGPGNGEPVIWTGFHPVDYVPWLYVVHTEVLDEQIGKFGFYLKMCKGLNTLSTPIALDEFVMPSRTWGDIVNNSGLAGEIKFVDRWDPTTQAWVSVTPTTFLDPLDAFYVYFFHGPQYVILYVNSSDGHPYCMPTRGLSAGWNLIGPNPIFPNPGMKVPVALSSIAMTPDALPGYTQAISPLVQCQDAWIYVPGMPPPPPTMKSGRGYWTWMENPDTLVGFGFSPLPAGP